MDCIVHGVAKSWTWLRLGLIMFLRIIALNVDSLQPRTLEMADPSTLSCTYFRNTKISQGLFFNYKRVSWYNSMLVYFKVSKKWIIFWGNTHY